MMSVASTQHSCSKVFPPREQEPRPSFEEFPCMCALDEGHLGRRHQCLCGFEWDDPKEIRVDTIDTRRDHI